MSTPMIELLSIIFILTSALAIWLPWGGVRGLLWAYTLGLIALYAFIPPVHWSNQGLFYPLVIASLLIAFSTIAAPLILRAFWEVYRAPRSFLRQSKADAPLAFLSGLVIALILFLQMSYGLAGTSVVFAHGTALSIAILIGFLRRPAALGCSIGVVALTLYSLSYPDILRSAAARVAPEGYTLHSPDPAGSLNLTFLGLPKFPHPRLHFEQGGQPATLGWSYRRRAFLPVWH